MVYIALGHRPGRRLGQVAADFRRLLRRAMANTEDILKDVCYAEHVRARGAGQ
jgi:hypothetical protein